MPPESIHKPLHVGIPDPDPSSQCDSCVREDSLPCRMTCSDVRIFVSYRKCENGSTTDDSHLCRERKSQRIASVCCYYLKQIYTASQQCCGGI